MKLSEYKMLVEIRFPNLNIDTENDDWPLSKIGMLERVALAIFMEGTKSNTKLNIITRKLLLDYKNNKGIFFDAENCGHVA